MKKIIYSILIATNVVVLIVIGTVLAEVKKEIAGLEKRIPAVSQNQENAQQYEKNGRTPAPREAKQVDLTVDENGFSPNAFQIYVDNIVTVKIKNNGSQPHSFVIDDLGIKTIIQPGSTGTTIIDSKFGNSQLLKFYSEEKSDSKDAFKGLIMVL